MLSGLALALLLSGDWAVETGRSKMDDSTSVTVSRQAEETITTWPNKTLRPTLLLRCQEGKTEAYIVTGTAANPEIGLHNEYTVTIRYGTAKATDITMRGSTDSQSLFFPNGRQAIERMTKEATFRFRFTPFNTAPQETSFSLNGLAEAVVPLRAACGWDEAALQRAAAQRTVAEKKAREAALRADTEREEASKRREEASNREEEEKARADQERLDLLRDLDAPESKKRNLAIAGLAPYRSRAKPAVAKLIEALRDESWGIRVAAVEALGKIGPSASDAIPALEAAAADPSLGIVGGAQLALERIRGKLK